MQTPNSTAAKKRSGWIKYGVIIAVIFIGFSWYFFRNTKPVTSGTTFKVRRGNLNIRVLEGGSIEALESQDIRSRVRGYQGTKILRIVDEGYLVTEEDVRTNKILVELDSSDLKQRIVNQDIQYQTTLAGLIEAQQAYDIQVNQNMADVKVAQQKARFARMDLEKYLGDNVAEEIIKYQRLYEDTNEITVPDIEAFMALSENETNQVDSSTNAQASAGSASDAASLTNTPAMSAAAEEFLRQTRSMGSRPVDTNVVPPIDFTKYASDAALGDGSAKQMLRKLTDDLQMARAQQSLAKTKLEGTRRLFAKKFVTKNELDSEQLAYDNNELKIKTAQTALDLYIKYEFPKSAEEALSKYEEALRVLTQTRRSAVSKIAQAKARLKSSERRFLIESEHRREMYDQFDKCIIKAEKTGLVVYGTDGHMFGGDQIREGANVREHQRIITIPDMKQMAVRIKIHESFIKKVTKGQKAIIRVDAYADEELTGEVAKVGILPDYQNRWMNPDLKVYMTMVAIQDARDWLKPGMSAKVEVMIKQLTNVVYVPLQSVSKLKGKHVCYVKSNGEAVSRVVDIGEFNDEFIEITSGLSEGEIILLNAPEGTRMDETIPELTENDTNATTSAGTPQANGDNGGKPAPTDAKDQDGKPRDSAKDEPKQAPNGSAAQNGRRN